MTKIKSAMLLAAGLGTRLRPITDTIPKPLVPVNGRTMLDRALDKLVAHGVENAVINIHHLADKVRVHLAGRDDIGITLREEPILMDTGGGVKQALPQLGDGPFFCLNTDLVWTDGAGDTALTRLEAAWDDASMDALMLMLRTDAAVGFGEANGDYFLKPVKGDLGRLYGRTAPPPRPFVWIAAQIMHPRAFTATPDAPFSNRVVWDRAEEAGRLWGLAHDGGGYHAGTPEDLDTVNRLLGASEAG